MRRVTVAATALLAAVGCSSGGFRPTVPTTPTTRPPAPSTTLRTDLTFRAQQVRLTSSEQGDNALRVLFDSKDDDVSVVLTGLVTPNSVVRVCPATKVDESVPVPESACRQPASGEAVKIAHGTKYKGVEVAQTGAASSGTAGNTTVIGEIAISFKAASRTVTVRLPPLAAVPSGSSAEAPGSRPTLRLAPPGDGSYKANLAWSGAGAGAGEAELALIGTPVNLAQGGTPVEISGTISPPTESSIRIRNTGSAPIPAAVFTATMP